MAVRQMYSIRYWCNNCGKHSQKSVPLGEVALDVIKCPRCQVFGAVKAKEQGWG